MIAQALTNHQGRLKAIRSSGDLLPYLSLDRMHKGLGIQSRF